VGTAALAALVPTGTESLPIDSPRFIPNTWVTGYSGEDPSTGIPGLAGRSVANELQSTPHASSIAFESKSSYCSN